MDTSESSSLAPRALIVGSVATDEPAAQVEAIAAHMFPRSQLRGRYGSILLGSDVVDVGDTQRRLLAHNCAVHLVPGGSLSVSRTTDALAVDLEDCGFEQVSRSGVRTSWRRTDRRTVHDLTAEARARLVRVTPRQLAEQLSEPNTLVVDLRIPDDRRRNGTIEGSVPIARTTLEWRADPTSGYSHAALGKFDQQVVVVCNEGYSSSIAASTLLDLGYHAATDLIGGMFAWQADGLPVVPAEPGDDELFEGENQSL